MKRLALILSLSAAAVLSAGGEARAQGRPGQDSVPRQYQPPAGMCRIWIDGVSPARQAAPTDCANAVRNRPPNGRVIFGPSLPRKNDRAPGRRADAPPASTRLPATPPIRPPAE